MDAVTVRENGFAEMAYVGQRPWHGLGQELVEGAPIDEWRVSAGMDWRIQRGIVRYNTSRDKMELLDDESHHVLFRSDTKAPLGLVSNRYKVVQPGDVLEFFRDLTDASDYTLNTAGTLFDGRRFWALASIGEEAVVMGDDKIGGYLLLSSSCDGSLATTARFTAIRVVCNNTLSMALSSETRKEIVVRHSTTFDARQAKEDLGIAHGQFGEFMKATRRLAKTPVTMPEARKFVGELLTETKTVTREDVENAKSYGNIIQLFNRDAIGTEQFDQAGSAWNLVNAVTEYVDHHARATSDSHRMSSAWFGRGDDLKTSAFERALAIAA